VSANHGAACFLLDQATPERKRLAEFQPAAAPPSVVDRDNKRLEITDLKMYFPIKKGILKRTVGHVRAVDGVNLKIYQGETLALVGESGCGKTTVGKAIVRLLEPTGGSIKFHGEELVGLKRNSLRKYRRRMQMIFQDPFSSLNPRLMIGETIIEGMETHRIGSSKAERTERVQALMQRVGLEPDMMHRYPHEFSGGQRQRIGVARALAVDPELVICDEATSSLDVSVQAQILNLLKDLQSDLGLSYLFITHDLSVVQYLSDRVSVMYLGRIVEEGTTEEIFDSPRHPYTQALLSAVPRVDETTGVKKIVLEGDVPSPINPPPGCHFHLRCPQATPECALEYPDPVRFTETHMCRCILYGRRNV
jgi:peptide/nickel transport system ATP-binding protein